MRYGNEHLEYLYQSQLKIRKQKHDETLPKYKVNIARLVRFAYPAVSDKMKECLGIQAFIYGLHDPDIQRTLHLAHPKTLIDELTTALEYEAATNASGNNKVRTIQEEGDEDRFY